MNIRIQIVAWLALAGAALAAPADSAPLPRTAPLAPAAALASFELAPGFRLEQVAAEPLVTNPVAMAFDEEGRLFVAELLDYGIMGGAERTLYGRIRRLVDADGDGRFETSTVFADKVSWPSSVFCHGGGLFVAATPDLIFLKDRDGDGQADERQVVLTGFGASVTELKSGQLFNGFAWGLDNRIYGATAGNGGLVRRPGEGSAGPLDLRNKDFSFDPRSFDLRAESGTAQFGQSFDDFGWRYVSSNHNHIRVPMYEYRYAERNPFFDLPRPLVDIPVDGGAAEVYRISPEEPWRAMRMEWRMTGKAKGGIEMGGRISGYFTAGCGVTIYRGGVFPAEFSNNAFVAEPANNLVHRKIIKERGAGLIAERAATEQKTEFLRSRDLWFRPTNFATGPDGALYVADMYRELIEDPMTIPEGIIRRLDLEAGNRMGRIYRVVPNGFRQPAQPRLGRATTAELVGHLAHVNGWYRDTAARLLHERQDASAVTALQTLVRTPPRSVAALHAMYALHGLGRLAATDTLAGLSNRDPHVRRHAVRLAEFLWQERRISESERQALRKKIAALASDPAPAVRMQVAFTLGGLGGGAEVSAALQRLARQDQGDEWIRVAVLNAAIDQAAELLEALMRNPEQMDGAEGRAMIADLFSMVGARGRGEELSRAAAVLASAAGREPALTWLSAFASGLRRAGVSLATIDPQHRLEPLVTQASRIISDRKAPLAQRINAIELAGSSTAREIVAMLLELLQPSEPQRVQTAAIAALARRSPIELSRQLVVRWPTFTPRIREDALQVLLAAPDRALLLLEAVRDGKVPAADLSATQRTFLRESADPRVRALAGNVISDTARDRGKVVESYRPALALPADATRGRAVFTRTCAACHQFNGEGIELGPNLATVKNGGQEKLLASILDPNREIDPAFLFFEIETRDAGTLLGVITGETPASLTIKQAYGGRTVVPRNNIVITRSLGRSMMPEGLEASLTQQDMADLIAYILTTE